LLRRINAASADHNGGGCEAGTAGTHGEEDGIEQPDMAARYVRVRSVSTNDATALTERCDAQGVVGLKCRTELPFFPRLRYTCLQIG
jgi:hypothetical protein